MYLFVLLDVYNMNDSDSAGGQCRRSTVLPAVTDRSLYQNCQGQVKSIV
jgi:hypothetical protein